MDKVTQQNAATAEESASASEQMKEQASYMKEYVKDLLSLMGGNVITTGKAKGKPLQRAGAAKRASRSGAGSTMIRVFQQPSNSHGRKRGQGGTPVGKNEPIELTPEQVIPLGIEDF